MIVYLDVFFIINFIADYFILFIVSPVVTPKKIQISVASLLGALYSCLYLFNLSFDFFITPVKLSVLFIMTLIAYYPLKLKLLVKTFILAYITAGFMCAITFCVTGLFTNNFQFTLFSISDLILIFSFSSGYILFSYSKKMYKKNIIAENSEISIFYMDKKIQFYGVKDNCNNLYDPITKKPVIVTDISIFKKLFGNEVSKNNLCEFVNPKDFCVIPYKTISDNGILYGFKPDKIIINKKTICEVIIALAPEKLENNALINSLIT